MFKKDLVSHINEDYKELKNLVIRIDGEDIDDKLYNLLTPYLAQKNTLDNENRVILYYSREDSNQQKLLPFYVGLSSYYKAFTSIKSKFSKSNLDTDFIESSLASINNQIPDEFKWLDKKWKNYGFVLNISKNNKIRLKIESIEKNKLLRAPEIQNLIPSLEGSIENYQFIKQDIEKTQIKLNKFLNENKAVLKYKEIVDSSETNIGVKEILELGNTTNISPVAGVLLFTNKTKYKKLIENTYINNNPLIDKFSIAEVIFKADGELSIVKYGDEEPIIFFCSTENYLGWKEIILELNVNYLNTLVIDDFKTIIQKEIRNEFKNFRDFALSINEAQKNNELKDVYLLDEDSNFHNSKFLKKFNLDIYPWLLNYQERNYLAEKKVSEYCHKTISINDEFGSKFWENFKPLILQLNSILISELSLEKKASILNLLKDGYDFLERATSYYCPQLEFDLKEFIGELHTLNQTIDSASLKNKINDINEVINPQILTNNKLQAICKIILLESRGPTVIVSKNINKNDQIGARNHILKQTNQEIDFIDLDVLMSSSLKPYQNAFFLHFSGDHSRTLFLSKFCKNQYIILNDQSESGYYRKCFYRYTPNIIELSDFDNKLILLHLENKENLIEKNKIEYRFEDYFNCENNKIETNHKNDSQEKFENESQEIESQNFSFVIDKIIQQQKTIIIDSSSNNNQQTTYLILFEKSFMKVPHHKYFHILEDNDYRDEIEFKKKVTDLRIGDKVFVMEGFNDDFNVLLNFLKNEHQELANYFDAAECWRQDLNNYYEREGGYYSRLNSFLKQMGIKVTNPTVEKWVNGITIMPDSLPQLIKIFRKEEKSNTSKFPTEQIIKSTHWLAKFRTSLHKEIFQYHVFKKYGMYQQINNLTLKTLIEKMDNIVNIQEVIMIQKN